MTIDGGTEIDAGTEVDAGEAVDAGDPGIYYCGACATDLDCGGTDNMTPWTLQADIMNGVDPSPQNVSLQESLFSEHKVKVFLYNQQVTDSLTETFLADAHNAGIPVVGVYETMPTPGYTYQTWMEAEVNALNKAVTSKVSTEHL